MRAACIILLLVLPMATANASLELPFTGSAPFQFEGANATAGEASWVRLILAPNSTVRFSIDADGPMTLKNFTAVKVTQWSSDGSTVVQRETGEGEEQQIGALHATWSPTPSSWSSLYLEADRITSMASKAKGTMEILSQSVDLDSMAHNDAPEGTIRANLRAGMESVAWIPPSGALEIGLRLEGLRVFEWHNGSLSCSTTACPKTPSGGESFVPTPLGYLRTQIQEYYRITASQGNMSGNGDVLSLMTGGPAMVFGMQGQLRIPRGVFPSACELGCQESNRTFLTNGTWTLGALTPTADGNRLQGHLSGDLTGIRLDETDASNLIPLAAVGTTAVVVGGVAAFAKALLGLFARRRERSEVLGHPSRRKLANEVLRSPGVHLREISRRTNMTVTNARHHLGILARTGLVERQRVGRHERFYPKGHAGNDAGILGLLQDANLRKLATLIGQRPGITQSQVVEIGAAWSWSRSTTQHRLKRLHENGVVTVEQRGRSSCYSMGPRGRALGSVHSGPLLREALAHAS